MEQRNRILVEYVNAIITFFAQIQNKRNMEGLMQSDDNRLSWKDLSKHRGNHPLPTLQEFFREAYPRTTSWISQDELNELNYVITRLNLTEDVLIWKRAVNRLLQILQGSSYRPFYTSEEFGPSLSLEETD